MQKPPFTDVLILYNFSNLSNSSNYPSIFPKLNPDAMKSGENLRYKINAEYLPFCHLSHPCSLKIRVFFQNKDYVYI